MKEEYGLWYMRDKSISQREKLAFTREHDEREPDGEKEVLCSRIGKAMKAYFEELVEMGVVGEV